MRRYYRTVLLSCAFFAAAAGGARAADPASIQLVGTFNGITCEPTDPANDMDPQGNHVWRKLKFINEPGDPDTIFFKFTKDRSYLPEHWGWSGVWGIAELAWSPPSIAKVLPDSGFYYFYFNDADYTYWLDRPAGNITGAVSVNGRPDLPPGTTVTLFDAAYDIIGTYDAFADSTYYFAALGPAVYEITAHAPGYRDTTITGIDLGPDETKSVSIHLREQIGVLIASAECRRLAGGVSISWYTMDCGACASFDVYRGYTPDFAAMEKRNGSPVRSDRVYEFFDPCENSTKDLYYYLVEIGGDSPTHYGPLSVKGIPAPAAALGQNYPNPFNPSTTIPYTIGASGSGRPATISFYNVSGALVDSYSLGAKQAGDYAFMWNPSFSKRSGFPSGVYYCRLQVGKEIYTRKVILLR
ncbi:MAG: T9SS type A sorting domain-containing protein [Candidatus Krumholzibacteria bacterium]|nr:T9SS type A sorting domain-containing protein [Candidatus Krumholzibacteria bacterium]